MPAFQSFTDQVDNEQLGDLRTDGPALQRRLFTGSEKNDISNRRDGGLRVVGHGNDLRPVLLRLH
ncbi:hypothetical protein D3C87_2139910 [compost metagenome]